MVLLTTVVATVSLVAVAGTAVAATTASPAVLAIPYNVTIPGPLNLLVIGPTTIPNILAHLPLHLGLPLDGHTGPVRLGPNHLPLFLLLHALLIPHKATPPPLLLDF